MKKKNKNLKIGLLLIVVVAVAYVMITNEFDFGTTLAPNDINGGTFSSTGSLYELSIFPNHLFSCTQDSELYAQINGQWKLITSDSDLIQTFVSTNIQERNTGNTIDNFNVIDYLTCDFPDTIDSLSVSGSTTTIASTGTYGHILIASDKKSFNVTLQDNKKTKITESIFSSEKLEPNISINSLGNGWLIFRSQQSATYTVVFDPDTSTTNDQVSKTINPEISELKIYVSIDGQPAEVIQDANTKDSLIEIRDIIQTTTNISVMGSTFDLDKGQQIKVKALMRDYKATDGLPQVRITGDGINVIVNAKLVGIENDNDGLFEALYLLPRETQDGKWTVKLSHDFRSGTSTRSFETINGFIPTETTTESTITEIVDNDDNTTTVNGLEMPTVNTKIQYTHRYDKVVVGGSLVPKIVTGVGESQTIKLNSITDSISFGGNTGVESVLEEIQLNTFVSADWDVYKNIKRATSSNTEYLATLSFFDGTQPITFEPFTTHNPVANVCFGMTDENNCPTLKSGIELDRILISDSKIEQELEKNNITSKGQKIKINVKAVDGTFTVIDNLNKQHMGSSKGTEYNYSFTYGASSINDENDDTIADSCMSSDTNVACVCPAGSTMTFNTDMNKVVCIDELGNITNPESDNTVESDDEFINEDGDVEPHCETTEDGLAIGFGNPSVDDPGCINLYDPVDIIGVDDPDDCPSGTTAVANDATPIPANESEYFCIETEPEVEADPEQDPEIESPSQPLIDCEALFGVDFCARAESGDFFSDNGVDDDNTMTVIGIILAIIVIMIAITIALRKRARGY